MKRSKHTPHQMAEFHRIATDQQARDRSDPFVYRRTMTHLIEGVYEPADYQARRETA